MSTRMAARPENAGPVSSGSVKSGPEESGPEGPSQQRAFRVILGIGALVAALGCGQVGSETGDRGLEASRGATSGPSASVDNPGTVMRSRSLSLAEFDALDDSVRSPLHNQNRHSDMTSGDWTAQDWRVFRQKIRWAEALRLDTLSMGDAVVRLAETFVGWTYTPQTLEVPGPERVVVNLAELDCVTFIENVLALVRYQARFGGVDETTPELARDRYEFLLETIRYRGGGLAGYTSRLHYFSEWLTDNQERGLVTLRTLALGGIEDAEPIDFMSTHPSAYPALANDDVAVQAIRNVENRLNASVRLYIPQSAIGEIAGQINDGDLIAATSTVTGLDIAHTGIAIRIEDRLHLLHAPLVGRVIEISELPLADRILGIGSQDGIMIATPLRGTN